jgi:hypothetical protein
MNNEVDLGAIVGKARDRLVLSAALLGMEEGDIGAIVEDLRFVRSNLDLAIDVIEDALKATSRSA